MDTEVLGAGAAITNKAAMNILTGIYPQEVELLDQRVFTFQILVKLTLFVGICFPTLLKSLIYNQYFKV